MTAALHTLDKLQSLFASVANIETAADGEPSEFTSTQKRIDAQRIAMEVELRDARQKLDTIYLKEMRQSLIDCIDSYTDAYQAQQSYSMEMFIQLPLAVGSILGLVDNLKSKLSQYGLDLPNSLVNFYSGARLILAETHNLKPISNKNDKMASLEE